MEQILNEQDLPKVQKVTLIKNVRVNGVLYKAGTSVDVDPQDYVQLMANGAIAPTPTLPQGESPEGVPSAGRSDGELVTDN